MPTQQFFYTNERNVQILIYLLKAYGVNQVIVSPGTTHVTFVHCVQIDSFFKLYSCIDERSAAYMACGLAAESGKPVVICCTQATASRNYLSGLTEAYYRKLPILAVTGSRSKVDIGSMMPQVIDRRMKQNDVCVCSVEAPIVKDEEDERYCEIEINKALNALFLDGGGPVHINLESRYSCDFSVKQLPPARVIKVFTGADKLPDIEAIRIGIFVGSHNRWSQDLLDSVEIFCKKYNAVVLYDHTSNYKGDYGVLFTLQTAQYNYKSKINNLDLLIHIGNISPNYYALINLKPANVWRVNPDGKIADLFHSLKSVFKMNEENFFEIYNKREAPKSKIKLYEESQIEHSLVLKSIPEIPFSNLWICKNFSKLIPLNSILHFGRSNSSRSINMFDIDRSVYCYSNVGGCGIDGNLSSLIGSTLVEPLKLHFCILGDLSFFYDINSLGNINVGKNIRILLVNNGLGVEFKVGFNFARIFGEETNPYIAAEGHYGNKSQKLVRHFTEDLGFEYLTANDKKSFLENLNYFCTPELTEKPIVFEVFTEEKNEHDALEMILSCYKEH